ncbi:beta-glucosidase family protein [Demequina lutea]|uniref:Beta-xylosidase n=1 Tax=Demequina lutea TaxID=431489 RepID=A0A7Y9ZCY6_9MICO|nr:glycoside hydrolase family 3 N-terminal domain-containing protein [Demequina lutea]NYI42816.1 beta-xylosidase [Demequina lutea]
MNPSHLPDSQVNADASSVFTGTAGESRGPWNNPELDTATRVAALLKVMSLEEKVAQLSGVWVGADDSGGEVAPQQHEMEEPIDFDARLGIGVGQLTRPFGTKPIDPALGALSLARTQQRIVESNRFGIPAIAHEECLTGFATWGATTFPTPLAWGATFDPALIEDMGEYIGTSMRKVGVHQGLAPVLDVAYDPRWGRTEETIGEDPYLVGTIGSAYVRGMEKSGIITTLKHFAGYSASREGRNLAPVSIGWRELRDVVLPPFEMAIREAGARSVMNSYAALDGLPVAADRQLLTDLLRSEWGFKGTVVADYFAIPFLQTLHGVASDVAEAAAQALRAGIDVELPTTKAYGAPLLNAVREGAIDEALVDQAATRVLSQKVDLGLLDPEWSAFPECLARRELDDVPGLRGSVSLNSDVGRGIARRVADESIVLLSNDGTLPIADLSTIAVFGPSADFTMSGMGGYAFPSHVGIHHSSRHGIDLISVLAALKRTYPSTSIRHLEGTPFGTAQPIDQDAIGRACTGADLAVVALGDNALMWGKGTSGEGSDAPSLELPGFQRALLEAVLATGTTTVVVLLAGRPYALGPVAERCAAIVQAFFPGQEGSEAVVGVLSGRVAPSGRLPVSVPSGPGGYPRSYLSPALGHRTEVSAVDPTPLYPFGHGLSYTTFDWYDGSCDADEVSPDDVVRLSVAVRNTGNVAGVDVVQVYLTDPWASVSQPLARLVGYTRVTLEPGASAIVTVDVPIALAALTNRDGRRVVEPGALTLSLRRSSANVACEFSLTVVCDGPVAPDATSPLSSSAHVNASDAKESLADTRRPHR